MKYVKSIIIIIGLFGCAILYWNLRNHQAINNHNVVIQQLTETAPHSPKETSNKATQNSKNLPSREFLNKNARAKSASPRAVNDITHHEDFHNQKSMPQQNNLNFYGTQTNDTLFIDHNDADFYDTQEGPDTAFMQSHQYTDKYTGSNPTLDYQLEHNNDLIIMQTKLINDLMYNHSTMYNNAMNRPHTVNTATTAAKAIQNNYNKLSRAQENLNTLYEKENKIMAARKKAHEIQIMNQSMFTQPSIHIKTNVTSPYNRISNMIQSSPFMKANTIQWPAAKPVETSSLIEVD
ncbi:MAG: hypothetical protein Q8Q60_02315 [Candidatus Chromulinivorax sp.]|nr:hypothetical protein [Candidatus Chromulinivorax sp.]